MNTLSRAITAQFFPQSDSYNAFRTHWSALINSERRHTLSAAHHLLYLALTGKDWRKAFTPMTNLRKLANGAFWNWGLFRALQSIHFQPDEQELLAPFEGAVSSRTLNILRSLLPTAGAYTYQPSDFSQGSFPFDAYSEPSSGKAILPLHQEESHE